MYAEEDFIQLSALQHFIFCPRQCALIHIEQLWSENVLTAEGRIMHENVHKEFSGNVANVKITRGMPLNSFSLGLSGKADVVEFVNLMDEKRCRPYPVEYKRGKPKADNSDKVQLCAQGICIEEMMDLEVPEGALFYGKTRHRSTVIFNDSLREETEKISLELHKFIKEGKTPLPSYSKKCDPCSFFNECLPKILSKKRTVRKYLLNEISY
jgi:CRISPR-associated exonuclease Cas4